MPLRGLCLLVLAVLLGTAVSVHWYLQADAEPGGGPEVVWPAPSLEHVPLPLRAEPARLRRDQAAPRGVPGVARSNVGQPVMQTVQLEVELRAAAPEATSAGAFTPPSDSR